MSKTPKRPRDLNQWAKRMVDLATGDESGAGILDEQKKNTAAVARGHLGGIKGGPIRAARLTAGERSEIARSAARTRWKDHQKS